MYNSDMNMEQFSEMFVAELTSSLLSSWLPGLAAFIMMAVGLYAIAKRRGINNPWLAWIPFGQTWLLGCISDQYQYVAKGQEKSKRKTMLWLEILTSVSGVVAVVMLFTALFQLIPSINFETGELVDERLMESIYSEILPIMMVAVVLCFVMLGFAIALVVLNYMALFDLYRSCDPNNCTLFTVLTIFLGGILQGIFVLVCRNKDYGMPPRRDQAAYGQTAYIPQQTWQQPQQTWQQPQQNWQQPQQNWQQPQQNWQQPQQTWQQPQQPVEQPQPVEEPWEQNNEE